MRASFQILALPYRMAGDKPLFCVFHRAEAVRLRRLAAKREIYAETGITADTLIRLTSMAFIPADIFSNACRENWPGDMYVVPEYAFAFACGKNMVLSHEHTACQWLPYEEAKAMLKWDPNRTALFELRCRLEASL